MNRDDAATQRFRDANATAALRSGFLYFVAVPLRRRVVAVDLYSHSWRP